MTSVIKPIPRDESMLLKSNPITPITPIKSSLPDWKHPVVLYTPEDKKKSTVSTKEAEQSLNNILTSPAFRSAGIEGVSITNVEKLPMESLAMMSTSLGISLFSDLAECASKSMKIQTAMQENERNEKVKQYQEQLAKSIEAADKAKKGAIVSVAFDWTIATAELAYGAVKVAGGIATGDGLAIAGGSAYMAAGLAGIVKATCETLIIAEIGDKKKLQEVADIAGKIQFAMEITASAIDLFQAGKAVYAARSATSTGKAVMQQGAPELAEQTTKAAAQEGSKQAAQEAAKEATKETVEQLSKEIAKESIEEVMQQMPKVAAEEIAKQSAKESVEIATKEAGKEAGKAAAEEAAKKSTKELVQESIERQAKNSMEQAVQKAAGEAFESGAEVSAQELAKAASKNFSQSMIEATFRAALPTAMNGFKAMAEGANQISTAVNDLERAELKKKIDELIAKQDFAEWCFQWYAQMKEESQKIIKDAVTKQGSIQESGSAMMTETSSMQVKIAQSMI